MNPRRTSTQIRNAFPPAALTVALLAGAATAQQQQRQQQDRQQQQQWERHIDDRAERAVVAHTLSDNIIRADVVDPRGESLGSIGDLVVDLRKGEAPYGVVEFGGLLGFDRDKVAVPMELFEWDYREERFVLDTTRERLEAAPEFDEEDLDKVSETTWIDQTMEVFGIERDGNDNPEHDRERRGRYGVDDRERDEDDKHRPFVMASDIDEIKIHGDNGEEVGPIDELVLDRNSGRVTFATIGLGGLIGIAEDTHLVPWEAMERADERKMRTKVSKERVENSPELREERQLRDTAFIQAVYRHYEVEPERPRDREERRDRGG